MSIRRVGVLLGKELIWGPKNFLFVFALIVPVAVSLLVSLIFGTLFSQKPKLGIAAEGGSQIVALAGEVDSLVVREFVSAAELKSAVASGAVDMGISLPPGFDGLVSRGERAQLFAYIWGESLLKNRVVLGTTLAFLMRELAGQESPVEIVTATVGDAEVVPWADRLLPFVVLMGIIIGGIMVPATSLVEEKQKRTLTALIVTPAALGEVFAAKAALGTLLSLFMGALILLLNRAFGVHPLLLVLVLALGAMLSSQVGVLLGAYVKDINTLFATIKAFGIVLYAPALIYLFPEIPDWIGRIFPTYYIVNPVVAISQRNADWAGVRLDVIVLIGLNLALIGVAAVVVRRARLRES
jgi:ABC-2 type transport system permease protein